MAIKDPLVEKAYSEELQRGTSLGHRAVKGGMWMLVLRIVHRGLGFIRTIVLARLLSPGDFGIFGIALLAINFIENFSVTGINMALVQKKESIRDYLDSAWTINVVRAFILFAILFFGAPAIASFFESSEATSVIRALAFIQFFSGAENIGTIYFQKDIRFDKVFWLKFGGMVANVVVSLLLAFILKNIWALVYGALCGAFIKMLLSYVLHPYRPKLRIETEKVKELLHFGKWAFGSSILVFLITQGDDIFVGKILGPAALGLYQMAYLLSNSPATEISNFVAQITFPVYSKMQHNLPMLRDAYFRVLQLVAFLAFPISGLILILADDFTDLFLGEKWLPMVSAMQVLTIWGLIRAIGTTTTQVFNAVGHPDLSTKVKFSQLLLMIIAIYPLTSTWGILGTSLAIVWATLIPNMIACYKTIKLIQGSIFGFSKILLLPLLNTLIMLAVITGSKMLSPTAMMFFVNIFIGLGVYIAFAGLFNHCFNYDIWFVLRKAHESIIK